MQGQGAVNQGVQVVGREVAEGLGQDKGQLPVSGLAVDTPAQGE